jgi:hypothetical protein
LGGAPGRGSGETFTTSGAFSVGSESELECSDGTTRGGDVLKRSPLTGREDRPDQAFCRATRGVGRVVGEVQYDSSGGDNPGEGAHIADGATACVVIPAPAEQGPARGHDVESAIEVQERIIGEKEVRVPIVGSQPLRARGWAWRLDGKGDVQLKDRVSRGAVADIDRGRGAVPTAAGRGENADKDGVRILQGQVDLETIPARIVGLELLRGRLHLGVQAIGG